MMSIHDFQRMFEMLLVRDLCGWKEAGVKGGSYELRRCA